MYTLEGRLHFDVKLSEEDEYHFRNEKLREIVLSHDVHGFNLTFSFGQAEEPLLDSAELPEYIMVIEPDALTA